MQQLLALIRTDEMTKIRKFTDFETILIELRSTGNLLSSVAMVDNCIARCHWIIVLLLLEDHRSIVKNITRQVYTGAVQQDRTIADVHQL